MSGQDDRSEPRPRSPGPRPRTPAELEAAAQRAEARAARAEAEADRLERAAEDGGPGLNPTVLIVALAVVGLAIFGLFFGVLITRAHQNSAPVAVATIGPDQQAQATFAPLPTAAPTPTAPPTPTPLRTFASGATPSGPAVPPLQPQPAAPAPQVTPQPPLGSSRMNIEQPPQTTEGGASNAGSQPAVSAQDRQALTDLSAVRGGAAHIIYVPVRDSYGHVSAVVPQQMSNSSPASSAFVSTDEAASLASSVTSQNGQNGAGGGASKVGYVAPISQDELQPTTVIPVRLVSQVVSDLPGTVTATVTADVRDSATHSRIVIPRGTTAEGIYDSGLVAGQTRIRMAWPLLIFPPYPPWNAREFALGGQPGADALGTAGLSGTIDSHRGEIYRSAFLLTVLGTAEALLTPNTAGITFGGQSSVTQQAASAAGAQLANVGNRILEQQVQRPPTITLSPPYEMQIRVTRDLPLDAFEVNPNS